MTIRIDPLETYEVGLLRDKTKPPDKQRKFICKVLSCRGWRSAVKLIDSLPGMGAVEGIDAILKELESIIVGWKGIVNRKGEVVPYTAEGLQDVINEKEIVELLQEIVTSNGLSDEDRKKSEWPSTPEPDASASNAIPQDAQAVQASKNPLLSNVPSVMGSESAVLATEDNSR